jgi:molybdenum cofactor cytidylyltransferase
LCELQHAIVSDYWIDMKEYSDIAAVILAGGFSKRMGRFKPLLPLGDRRSIERVVHLFRDAGIEKILVVVGHRGADIRRAVAPLNVICVANPDYAEGMFTSVLAGVRALPEDCRGFFIHPADIPLVRHQTVTRLAKACEDLSTPVIYPTFQGRRGHPTLISARLVPHILEWPGTGGLRSLLQRHAAQSLDLPVADEAVVLDLDTPEDYSRILARLAHEGLPSEAECRVLMEEVLALPDAVAAHCRTVAKVARRLADAVNTAGLGIDAKLVHTAALLHDIARAGRDHARSGARLLGTHGFIRLAPIVAAHMDLEIGGNSFLDETQIVYLADKLVAGDKVVDLEERFARKLAKYGREPAAAAAIARRRDVARCIRDKVAGITGLSVDSILMNANLGDGESR